MTRIEKFIQLKAFARQDALLLSLMWIISFACIVIVPAGAIGNLIALATPFVVGWRLCKFRDYALDGIISFRRAYAYGVYTFFYASLIFALAQFAYFQFLDHGAFADTVTEAMALVAPAYKQSGMTQQQINESMDIVKMLTPIQWAFMFMMQNLVLGAIASLPIALLCKRNGRWQNTANSNNQ